MSRHIPLLLLLLLPVLLAVGRIEPSVRLGIRVGYDHSLHARVNEKTDFGCVTCHVLSTPLPGQVALAFEEAPRQICHDCHCDGHRKERKAPRQCDLCHDVLMKPDTHGADWISSHALDARLSVGDCYACHSRSTCIDCHQRRDGPGSGPHDPAFLQVHGVVALADPASCSECHARHYCEDCHNGATHP